MLHQVGLDTTLIDYNIFDSLIGLLQPSDMIRFEILKGLRVLLVKIVRKSYFLFAFTLRLWFESA